MTQPEKSIKHIAVRKGTYLGVLLSLVTLIAYWINWDIFLSTWLEASKLPVILFVAIMAAVKSRKTFPVNFSFKNGFSAFFITIAVALAVSLVVKWLLYNYIDVDFGKYINHSGIVKRKEQLEQMGIDPEKINQEIKGLEHVYLLSFKNLFQEYILRLVGYCIPGVIVALILKTKKPLIR